MLPRNASKECHKRMPQKNASQNRSNLIKLANKTREFYDNNKKNFDVSELGNLLNEVWELKKGLANNISNNDFDKIYEKGIDAGALGGKLLGAGGGGFFLFVVKKEMKKMFIEKMKPLLVDDFKIDTDGARVIEKNFN